MFLNLLLQGQQIKGTHVSFFASIFYIPLKYVTIILIVSCRWSKFYYQCFAYQITQMTGVTTTV